MSDIEKLAYELKTSIEHTGEYKEFMRLKKLYDSNEEIKSYKILLAKYEKDSPQYNEVLKEYNSYPLVVNYIKASEDLKALLLEIKAILEK